jgi:hypothetical protein
MQSTTAVDEVIGSVMLARALSGKTTAKGSRASTPTKNPMLEFQKPTTVQGRVTANNASRLKVPHALNSGLNAACMRPSIATKLSMARDPKIILLTVSIWVEKTGVDISESRPLAHLYCLQRLAQYRSERSGC